MDSFKKRWREREKLDPLTRRRSLLVSLIAFLITFGLLYHINIFGFHYQLEEASETGITVSTGINYNTNLHVQAHDHFSYEDQEDWLSGRITLASIVLGTICIMVAGLVSETMLMIKKHRTFKKFGSLLIINIINLVLTAILYYLQHLGIERIVFNGF
ncbi:hypothetical protein [Halalkalibacillus halophilus]|uniref:hypothetical protein n=1 Tax=Halalkalibacillus halophilus TaxID=392827 RepID=UPI0012EC169E|nr:hypothetical protein [Halalkalibacillus halophilus]